MICQPLALKTTLESELLENSPVADVLAFDEVRDEQAIDQQRALRAAGRKGNEVVCGSRVGQHFNPVKCELDAGVASCALHLRTPCGNSLGAPQAVKIERLVRHAIERRIGKEPT